MKLDDFIKIVKNIPIIETEILLAGVDNPGAIKVQISRWLKAGKIIQLKRGVYLLSEAYRKIDVFEPCIASILKKPSYLSLEKALEYHGLIPEAVSVYTSVTPKMPTRFKSEVGVFDYRHIKNSLFWGYSSVTLNRQTAFIALPEKALLDFVYLNGAKISLDYLNELRLQNVKAIDCRKLLDFANKFRKPKVIRAARIIEQYIRGYKDGENVL